MDNIKTGGVVAIGNFDGVHKGHAALLAQARKIADENAMPLSVLTFEPHPRQFFKPSAASFRLTPESVKERRLKALGVDAVEILDFNAIMASLTPEQFVDMIIVDMMQAKHVVVGSDFHFGKDRMGHVDTLLADGRFAVTPVMLLGDRLAAVSSTRIRQALSDGNIDAANDLLGWEWEMEGEVIHGDKRGRELGYPTANIPIGETMVPAHGIYAVRVKLPADAPDAPWRPGVASLGMRPMFAVKAPLLEVFLFDFSGDLYGQSLRVRPVRKLRNEEKFADLEALKAQMALDEKEARALLS